MVDQFKIPEPTDSGADGTQVKDIPGTASELMESHQLEKFPIARAIEGLAASNTRVFGSEAASALIVGATSHMASELNRTQNEVVQLRGQIDKLRDRLSDYTADNAVLRERISSFRSNRHLRNLGVFVGTTLLGVGVQLVQENQNSYGLVFCFVGVLLLIFSWYSAPQGGDK